jgi:hypothetical protein
MCLQLRNFNVQTILDYSIRHADIGIPCITHKQFTALQRISSVLLIARRAQQLLSAERTPTLALALPLYELIIKIWRECLEKFPEQGYAISLAISKLEEYVVKSRTSSVHAFAMFVNPHLKLSWINEHWTPAEAEQALAMIKARVSLHTPSFLALEHSLTHRI